MRITDEIEARLRAEVERNTAPFRDPDIAGLSHRLRCRVLEYNDRQGHYAYIGDDCALDDRVADTLERQAAEIERLWEALSEAELDVGDMERERAF